MPGPIASGPLAPPTPYLAEAPFAISARLGDMPHMSNMNMLIDAGMGVRELMDGGSQDNSDDDSDGGYDSVHSVRSPSDELYDLQMANGELSEEYGEYLEMANQVVDQEHGISSESEGERSAASSRTHSRLATPPGATMASRLMDIGIFDIEGPVGFLADDHTDVSHETDSDGELSNLGSEEDDDDDLEEEFEEVPNPPQLQSVSEERLQEVWPLGDQSFSVFMCPITHDVMTDPVVAADGYTYERSAIARWFETSRKSPVTGQSLPHTDLVANHSVRTLLKTLIDMTEGTSKATPESEKAQPKVKCNPAPPPKPDRSVGVDAVPSALRAVASNATAHPPEQPVPAGTNAVLAGLAAMQEARQPSDDTPQGLDGQRSGPSQAEPNREPSNRSANLQQMEAATMAAVSASLSGGPATSMAASTAALARRQQERAQAAQVLLSQVSTETAPGYRAAADAATAAQQRPSSQPQPPSNHANASHHRQEQRPQSSSASACQHRPQAPSTTLPPLRPGNSPQRPGHSAVMTSDTTAGRGSSPPLIGNAPPLMGGAAYRNAGGRMPGHFSPPSVPSEGRSGSSQSSNHSTASQYEAAHGHRHKRTSSLTSADQTW